MKKTAWLPAAGAALFLVSNGRWIVPAAAWLAPALLIPNFRRLKPGACLALGAALFPVFSHLMLRGIIPQDLGALTWGLTVYFGWLWLVPYLLDRFISRRIPGFAATLVFPAAAVAVEYANALVFGNWGSTAFSQSGNPALMQILSVTGIWGATFLVSWFGAVLAWLREGGWERGRLLRAAAIYGSVLAGVLLFGGARLAFTAPAAETVRIGGFTLPRGGDSDDVFEARLFSRTRDCASRGAAIVVWPEGSIEIPADREGEFVDAGRRTARQSGVFVLLAFQAKSAEPSSGGGRNMSVFIDPEGRVLWRYVKSHPVPGSTDLAGDGVLPYADTPHGRIGSVICYDMDFPPLARQAGRAGVDIMLVPAWDWRAIDPLHARMAEARAIENGFSMFRQTGEGLSLAVDPLGRVRGGQDYFETEDRIWTADLPTNGLRTVYAAAGDLLAWLCAAALPALPILARRRIRKRS